VVESFSWWLLNGRPQNPDPYHASSQRARMLKQNNMVDVSSSHAMFSFLEMLSVKRANRFMSELEINVEEQGIAEVRRFARACLETYIHAEMYRGLRDSLDLRPNWNHYRASAGALDDQVLAKKSQEIINCEIKLCLKVAIRMWLTDGSKRFICHLEMDFVSWSSRFSGLRTLPPKS
jgi:hypothetical protein